MGGLSWWPELQKDKTSGTAGRKKVYPPLHPPPKKKCFALRFALLQSISINATERFEVV